MANMAKPSGEDSWLAYLEETVRNASDLEQRVHAVEQYKRAVAAEPGSLRVWLSYCDYFWSLWEATQAPASDGWTDEERMMGRELFSFGAALDLWQQGYEAIQYRLSDSHLLWDRWVSLEMELLSTTRTPEGVKRITHLYCDRLQTPHVTWEETSQNYSNFLSNYNPDAWLDSMKDITNNAQEVKRLIAARDPFELKIKKAASTNDVEAEKAAMTEYLEWEVIQSKRSNDNPKIAIDLCRGLYARALTGVLATDQTTWYGYIVFLSSSNSDLQSAGNLLDVLRRAVQRCPWSGRLWNRYILCAEEARLPFAEIESIKHTATSEGQLLDDGMEGMIEMYAAWCGFLKRTAIDATATDESVDLADVGLSAALEDVTIIGRRLYGKDFQGDPKFRLERIYIQYLTEKKGAVDEARAQWNKLAALQMHANSHDFWFRYYMWEMLIFSSTGAQETRSPTPSSTGASFRTPSLATAVLVRAVTRKTIDWPEKVLEVYMQHCNDYEPPLSVRKAADRVHRTEEGVKKRRKREMEEKAAEYDAYYRAQGAQLATQETDQLQGSKRKRESPPPAQDESNVASKRQKAEVNDTTSQTSTAQEPKRDRENSTILVTNLPGEVPQTKVRQYFKDYGVIKNITALVQESNGSSTALIEFSTPEEAQSALLRDGKYFEQSQLSVQSGHDLTVFVANFPPIADEKYIRDLFEDCGEILSIRWPNLKANTRRRFCYVSFRDQAASAKAVQKEGTLLDEKYNLLSKYSDPGSKKSREGALVEGREIHINNIDRAVTELDLRKFFSQYGKITRVNVPLNLGGNNRGFAYIDFATKEEAEKAVAETNDVKFRRNVLEVAISKDTKFKPSARVVATGRDSASPAPPSARDHEGDETIRDAPNDKDNKPTTADVSNRTIALMGLPDTVNDARVLALVEPMGSIVQLILQPMHGGAKIEFTDAANAGKAALQLNGMEFEGHKLRTGSVDELRHAKAEHREDSIVYGSKGPGSKGASSKTNAAVSKGLVPPPTTIRRPVLGGPRPRRGLGLPRNTAPSGSKNGAETNGTPAAKKNNSDFRTMFLSSEKGSVDELSKKQTEEGSKGQPVEEVKDQTDDQSKDGKK
ncbi:Splicing factor [Neonectria punicea]|uniref:Splicing factor n=1 Tax=Neonectria punicea TaxID=979145 RepID=A0ABR1H795_9HYPO